LIQKTRTLQTTRHTQKMLGLNPFDHFGMGYTHPRHYATPLTSRAAPPPSPRSEVPHSPDIELDERDEAYLISVGAPEGFVLDQPRAELNGREITLRGVLEPAAPIHEYITLSRTGVYAAPGRQMLGVVPARAVLRAGPPMRSGWVELAEEDGWVDAGSLRMLARPPPPWPFARVVELPADALAQRATTRTLRNGGLIISVPRRAVLPKPAAATPRAESRASSACSDIPPGGQKPGSRPATKEAAVVAPKPAAAAASAATTMSSGAKHTAKPATATTKRPRAAKDHAEGGPLPMSKEGPVLMECDSSTANVQSPTETTQSWLASPDGGFHEMDE